MACHLALWIGACFSSRSVEKRFILVLLGFVITLPGKSVSGEEICAERQFRCGNGHCIPLTWVCEREDDCGDNTDETDPRCKGRTPQAAREEFTSTPRYQLTGQLMTRRNLEPTPPVDPARQEGEKWIQIVPKPERHFVGGLIEAPSALRMFGMIRNLPLNFVDTGLLPRRAPERCPGCRRRRRSVRRREEERGAMESPLLGKKEATTMPTADVRKRKRPVKARPAAATTVSSTTSSSTTTPQPSTTQSVGQVRPSTTPSFGQARPTPASCCKQQYADFEEMSESQLRRETARMNLDVLRRLASMLGEEREKLSAERQMLSASRNMLLAETRKMMSERGKLESERQKVDLERDLLQSQVLSRGRRIAGE